MAQALRKQVPGLTAAHLASFTTVPAAPELHVAEFRDRASEVLYPQWWRNPAIVMRGWGPRDIAPVRPLSDRIAAAAHYDAAERLDLRKLLDHLSDAPAGRTPRHRPRLRLRE